MKTTKETNVKNDFTKEIKEKENEKTTKKEFEIVEDTFDDLEFEQDENQSGFSEVYFVKMKTKDAAYFEFSKKQGDSIHIDTRKTIQTISGRLTDIKMDSYMYENKEIKTIKLSIVSTIKDKDILFMLSTSYTQSCRTLINSLLSVDVPLEKICITLYKNSAGYSQLRVSVNGSAIKWKYDYEFQKSKIDVIKNKKGEFISNDYSELDEFFEFEIIKKLKTWFPKTEQIKFVDEDEDDTSTFGEDENMEDDETTDFFNIDNTEEK